MQIRPGRRRHVCYFEAVAFLHEGRHDRANVILGFDRRAIRSEPVIHRHGRSIGNDVSRNSTLDEHGLHRLAKFTSIDDRSPVLDLFERCQQPAKAMDGVAAHPRPSRVRTCATEGHTCSHRSLTACLEHCIGWFAQDRDIGCQ